MDLIAPSPLVASIQAAIHNLRGARVMLDSDLARLYGSTGSRYEP